MLVSILITDLSLLLLLPVSGQGKPYVAIFLFFLKYTSFNKGGFQTLISPSPPADPLNHWPRVVGKRQMNPHMLRAHDHMARYGSRREACLSLLYWPVRLYALIKSLVRIF